LCYILDMSKTDISTPLRPAPFYILLALADAPVHGYAAMQAVRERSGGSVRLSTGSFYRHLTWLLDEGLVEEASSPAGDDPRRGAYYRVTARGRQALTRERDRLAALVTALDALRPSPRRGRA
jgi:DNA-binding PadR family transcriptional regulator